jgi:myosin-15
VPSKVEVEAVTRGRNTKRQMCVLPGGATVVLNIRSCSVVQDAIDQICTRLEINDASEKEEFSVFYVVESENRYCPLQPEDYIFDITSELTNQKKQFYLLFQRSSWVFNIHMEGNALYIDVMFYTVIMDYRDGFFLPMAKPNSVPEYIKDQLIKLAAYQIRASDEQKMPTIKDVMSKIPGNAHQLSDMTPQKWSNDVQAQLTKINQMSPHQAKCAFLDTLSRWPLFGSTFFSIKSVADPRIKGNSLLAINKAGVHFLHPKSHETLITYPMSDIISTRRFQDDSNTSFLDIKTGNLMTHSVTRIETNQGNEISGLIGQYIKINNHIKNPVSTN